MKRTFSGGGGVQLKDLAQVIDPGFAEGQGGILAVGLLPVRLDCVCVPPGRDLIFAQQVGVAAVLAEQVVQMLRAAGHAAERRRPGRGHRPLIWTICGRFPRLSGRPVVPQHRGWRGFQSTGCGCLHTAESSRCGCLFARAIAYGTDLRSSPSGGADCVSVWCRRYVAAIAASRQ